jgi:glycosyltransferase involved in cell wall biosynthesis
MSRRSGGLLAIVAAQRAAEADGIRDYTERLVTCLRARRGVPVALFSREPRSWSFRMTGDGAAGAHGGDDRLQCADALVLQYNPFSHGRRGFAPGLALAMLRMRCRRSRPTIALMVHETFVDAKNWRWRLMRIWQRTQLRALQLAADLVLCTIERWSDDLRRSWPPAPVHHLPVASNLPDRRDQRQAGRARLGVRADALVLCTFGLDHAGRLTDYILDAAAAVARGGRPVLLLALGTGRRRREPIAPGVTLDVPGFLGDSEAAGLLAAADMFLAPFQDGVSTRRTTVMAALQHAVAVVGTDGHLTDDQLRRATDAMRLVAVADRDGFVAAVCALADSTDDRRALAAAGRRLYEDSFDWPVLVDGLLTALDGARPRR